MELSHQQLRGRSEWVLAGVILAGLTLIAFSTVYQAAFDPVVLAVEEHEWTKYIVRPSILWSVMGALLFGFRTVLWVRYRPFPAATMADAPSLTVIIPAYNEGAMVRTSIESVAAAHYPRERLQILVVDDGSRDDTWTHIERVATELGDLVTPIRFPVNRGKREALAEGFTRARGDVVVTIDSDSVIDPEALLAAAGPFRDPAIGAVAGKVVVYNRHAGLITRMLHVRYVLSFDLLRAVESSYRTVYCCPGALTAYRTAVVRRVLGEWATQRFCGVRCTYGEDRALTNYILREGFHTVYQNSAIVRTLAPESYTKMCKMFLRWDRSYIREEIRFQAIVWKRPLVPRCIALCDRLITNLRYPVNYAAMGLLAYVCVIHPAVWLRLMIAIGVVSLFNALYFLRHERSMAFLYGVVYAYFSFFTMFWIFPYAALTLRARSWLTR